MSVARQFSRSVPATEMFKRRRIRPVVPGLFEVKGRLGDVYEVTIDEAYETSCSCPAGEHGRPCWHQVKALRYLLRKGLIDRRDIREVA